MKMRARATIEYIFEMNPGESKVKVAERRAMAMIPGRQVTLVNVDDVCEAVMVVVMRVDGHNLGPALTMAKLSGSKAALMEKRTAELIFGDLSRMPPLTKPGEFAFVPSGRYAIFVPPQDSEIHHPNTIPYDTVVRDKSMHGLLADEMDARIPMDGIR